MEEIDKRVTVIVPVYNNYKGLFETLDSIFMQDYPDIELIIIDDASVEVMQYKEKVDSYVEKNRRENIKKYIFYIQKKNVGTVKNVNTAIGLSSGTYIKLLASEDMLLSKQTLSKYVTFSLKQGYEVIFAKMIGIDYEGKKTKHLSACAENYMELQQMSAKEIEKKLYKCNFLPAPAAFFKKQIFQRFGLFIEDYRLVEDWPYWIHLSQNGVKFGYLDERLIYYRLSGDTSAKNYSQMFLEDEYKIVQNIIIPNDRSYIKIIQRFVNWCKLNGVKFYMEKKSWSKVGIKGKIRLICKYFIFYVYVFLQDIIFKVFKKKI